MWGRSDSFYQGCREGFLEAVTKDLTLKDEEGLSQEGRAVGSSQRKPSTGRQSSGKECGLGGERERGQ